MKPKYKTGYRPGDDSPGDVVEEMRLQREARAALVKRAPEALDELEEVMLVGGVKYVRRVRALESQDSMGLAREALAKELGVDVSEVMPAMGGRWIRRIGYETE